MRLRASATLTLGLLLGAPSLLTAQQADALPPGWQQFRQQVEMSGQSWAAAEARLRAMGILTPGNPGPQQRGDSVWLRASDALAPTMPPLIADTTRRDSTVTGLPVFGAALTAGGWDPAQLTTTWPAEETYQLGPGDELALVLTGAIDLAHTLTVTRDGQLMVPRVGVVRAGGRTLRAVRQDITQRLRTTYGGSVGESSGAAATVALSLTRPRTIAILVTGAVRRPGLVTIPGAGQVLHALLAAGGLEAHGSLREITVVRPGEGVVGQWDAYDLLLHGLGTEVALQAGDIVRVPVRRALVALVGGVNLPIQVEVRSGEALANLLPAAGGLAPGAEDGIATRIGRGAAGFLSTTWPASAWDRAPLEPGDSVIISVAAPDSSLTPTVLVGGAVWAPGPMAWRPGLRLSDALSQGNGLRPDALPDRILVLRRNANGLEEQLRAVWDTTGQRPSPNLTLLPSDRIEVFTARGLVALAPVRVGGAVRTPQTLTYREGMTARDAILLAGGMLPEAYADSIEVTRNRRGSSADTLGVAERYPFARMIPGAIAPSGIAEEITLAPGDHVTVLYHPYWSPDATVTLLGEVVSPGTYTLTRRSERISDVLARAGGLRSSAYPAGVRLRRAGIGAINIDLPKVLTNASYRDNLVMEAGDTVEVPAYVPVIRVRGAVQQPTAVAYVPGKRIDYYIDASGGATALGDAGKAFTQQANGTIQTTRHRFLFRDSRPMPLPGATVIVPEKPERTPTNWGGVLSGITGVLGSIITIIAISR